MRKRNIIFALLILSIVVLICLTGCSNNRTSSEDTKMKVVQELDYLDTKIVDIANKLNNITLQNYTITSEEINIGQGGSNGPSAGKSNSEESAEGQQNESSSQSQTGSETAESNITTTHMEARAVLDTNENDINWNEIKNSIEIINETWGAVILDLSNLNVNNDDILGFSATLDDCILSIEDENKADSLVNIVKLYSYIPKFEGGIYAENSTQNIKQVKSYLLNAYSIVEQDDWTGIETNISECEKTFKNIINDIDYIKDKEYKVNRTYVLIKELQNSLSYKDKKLFYVKYKNLIESINTL